jgi:hypothetical protein
MPTDSQWRQAIAEMRATSGDAFNMESLNAIRSTCDAIITRAEALASIHRRGFCQDIIQQSDRNHDGTLELAEAKVWISDHPEILERLRIGD